MIDDGWFDENVMVHSPPWPPADGWTPGTWRPTGRYTPAKSAGDNGIILLLLTSVLAFFLFIFLFKAKSVRYLTRHMPLIIVLISLASCTANSAKEKNLFENATKISLILYDSQVYSISDKAKIGQLEKSLSTVNFKINKNSLGSVAPYAELIFFSGNLPDSQKEQNRIQLYHEIDSKGSILISKNHLLEIVEIFKGREDGNK